MSQKNELKVNVLDVLEILVRKKWQILGFTFFVAACVAVYSLVVKPRYVSVAVIMPPGGASQSSMLQNIIKGTPLGKIGGLETISSNMPGEETGVYMSILSSRSIRMDLIKQFNLVHVYKFDRSKKYYIEDLLKALEENLDYERTRTGTITVSVRDQSPQRAAAMTTYMVAQLDHIYKRLKNEKNRNYREFLGRRLEVVKVDLAKAEADLVRFQRANRMIDVESQARATVMTGVNLEARYITVRGNLEVARKIYSEDHPRVRELVIQQEELEKQLKRLSGDKVSDFLLPYQQGPTIALDYLRLAREVKIQEAIFELMVQQHEEAKFEESRNTPTVQVLDAPTVPQKRVYPKRRRMVQLAFIAAFLLACGFYLVREASQRFAAARPDEAGRLRRLLRQTWSLKG